MALAVANEWPGADLFGGWVLKCENVIADRRSIAGGLDVIILPGDDVELDLAVISSVEVIVVRQRLARTIKREELAIKAAAGGRRLGQPSSGLSRAP